MKRFSVDPGRRRLRTAWRVATARSWVGPALLLCALALSATHLRCASQYALLLTIKGSSLVETFDLRVKDLGSGQVVLERVGEPVDPSDPNRDISRPGESLRVAVEFSQAGNYLVYVLGRAGQGSSNLQFALKDFQVNDVREVALTLAPMVDDADGDGYPACGSTRVDCSQVSCKFLDCDDSDPLVHPFAKEICGNGKDDDCSAGCGARPGEGDEPCEDADGDGVPYPLDCDDNDPCRSPNLKEAENLCTIKEFPELPKTCLEKMEREGRKLEPPYCGDGIDQDCNGQDVACKIDADCDGFSPPADCNDNDPTINPAAKEICDGVDNNCNGVVDEGCAPCDVDGDGHAAPDVTDSSCVDDQGQPLPRDDPDDYDSGVFPGATAATGGAEGGTVITALRGYCSYELEKNGHKRHRDVDHDGDGRPAWDDGCPPEECDRDGDGFAGPQCSPPKSLEDCDDDDPTVFPGAPDRCGDGIKQNCVADVPCSQVVDRDGDGWPEGVDCDDNPDDDKPGAPRAAEIHPWALEKCDGVDNDCDGLVDEGNPDQDGVPIRTDVDLCNNSNEGECGGGGSTASQVCAPGAPGCSAAGRRLSGRCACSRSEPNAVRDENNRVRCTGEDLGAYASPRCFGAIEAQIERCDDRDWDCNGRADDPQGVNPLADLGMTCGTNVGNCRAGVVLGCDLSRSHPEADLVRKVLQAEGKSFNPHWVCGPSTPGGPSVWLPTAEVCNGKDDDCDGNLPADEQDPDVDRYIACTGCTEGTGRLDLAPGLQGCDDCAPNVTGINPGAAELCDGIDNNCSAGPSDPTGLADDGADECTGGTSCCSDQKACKHLQSDRFNCGSCGNICPAGVSDSCVNGGCSCGGGATCGPGLDCQGGSCTCIQGGRCSGCCRNNVCQAGNTVAACGTGGEPCDNCNDGNECTQNVCSAGNCSNPNYGSTRECLSGSGRCFNGSCCTGCIGDNQCRSGITVQYCGTGGGSCSTCTAGQCLAPVCNADGTCSTTSANEGGSCTGTSGAGICRNGLCCDGNRCWDHDGSPPACVSASDGNCGTGGETCTTCGTLTSCNTSTGNCDCTGGCTSNGSCVAGTSTTACGPLGGTCLNCNTDQSPGVCEEAYCNNRTCQKQDRDDGTSCGAGRSCCSGACCQVGQSCCGTTCCSTTCCNNTCCGAGQSCCNNSCCDGVCCNNTCCSPGDSCCGTTCCGTTCCNDTCCSPGDTCCGTTCCGTTCCGTTCCDLGDTCCGTSCCPVGRTCCEGVCCNEGEDCVDGSCE